MKKYLLLIAVLLMIALASCSNKKDNGIKDGLWRGEFTLAEGQKSPFVFEITNADTDSITATLINAAERVPLKGITQKGDSVIIPVEAFDMHMVGVLKDGRYRGIFKSTEATNDAGIAFEAKWGNAPRFAVEPNPTTVSPEGKWDVQFITEKGDTTNNVGIFSIDNGILTGTILTTTGDMRYGEGIITADGFAMSAFSGYSPRILVAKFDGEDQFTANLYRANGITKLIAKRNDKAALADPFSLTQMKKGHNSLAFTFPNSKGKQISLSDAEYKDKVVIVSVLGSWCPNCLDELDFLVPWYNENKGRGVEVIGLAFEFKDTPDAANATLNRLINRYSIPYEILYVGKPGDETTAKALPALEKLKSYPTTIFIDKKGMVRAIHTGFNGPATGLFYEDFKKEFNELVDKLLAEYFFFEAYKNTS